MQDSIYNYQNLSSSTTMENYNIYKDDKKRIQRDITARFFYLGNNYNETGDDKKYHLNTYVILNDTDFGV